MGEEATWKLLSIWGEVWSSSESASAFTRQAELRGLVFWYHAFSCLIYESLSRVEICVQKTRVGRAKYFGEFPEYVPPHTLTGCSIYQYIFCFIQLRKVNTRSERGLREPQLGKQINMWKPAASALAHYREHHSHVHFNFLKKEYLHLVRCLPGASSGIIISFPLWM